MTMTPLPSDILCYDILPRLPDKSVHRFLCVCKRWQSFLTTPMFAKMHYDHHKLFLVVLSTTTPCKFRTIDCEAPEDSLSTVSRPLPFEAAGHENVSIVASVRGLVCVRIINNCKEKEYSDLILWNPSTDEYKTLSAPNNKECYVTTAKAFGLYYSCNDYKLLLVTQHRDVYMYSLKSDSWRKVETTQENFKFLSSDYWLWNCWEQPCVLLNKKLYFLIRVINMKLEIKITYSMIRFDLKTEKWKKIATPFETDPNPSNTRATCLSFTVVRGCIHLYVRNWNRNVESTARYAIDLWRVDGDGNWTKIVTYYQLSFPSIYKPLSTLHVMKNGNWLTHYGSGIDKIDVKKSTKKELCSSNSIIIYPNGKYMETLRINSFNKH